MEFLRTIMGDFVKVVNGSTPLLIDGLQMTVIVSIASIVIGLIVGLIACLMKMSKLAPVRGLAHFYIWVIRGTPMIVQAFFIFFGVNEVISGVMSGFKLSVLSASILTVSLNAGAYLAEIYRGGINAVPKGQTEAARSLGLTQGKTMRKIVLPQAIRISIPAMVNQFIITIKDTSILSVIGLGELTNLTKVYAAGTYRYFASYIYVGFWYLAIISVLMLISRKVEKSISYERKN